MSLTEEQKSFLVEFLGILLDEDSFEGSDLDRRQGQANRDLTRIVLNAELGSGERREFARRKSTLSADIRSAAEADDFNEIDRRIAALGDDVDAAQKIATARAVAEHALAEAETLAEDIRPLLDRGGALYVDDALVEIRSSFGKARSQRDYTAVKATCVRFVAMGGKAAAYGEAFDKWIKASAAMIATLVPDPKTTAWNDRNAALEAAALASRTGDFDGAAVALDTFTTSAHLGGADFAATADFIAEVAALEQAYGGKLADIVSSNLRGVAAKKTEIAAIRKQGVTNNQVTQAQARIAPLKAWVDGNWPLAQAMTKLDNAARRLPDFRNVLTDMERERSAGRWAAALAVLDRVFDETTELGQQVASIVADKKLKATYQQVLQRVPARIKAELQTRWDDHHTAATANPVNASDANAKLNALRNWLAVGDFYDVRDQIAALQSGYPEARGYGYGEKVRALTAADNYPAALAAAKVLVPKIERLCAYLDARKEAVEVQNALPTDPPELREMVEGALNDSEAKARSGDPDGALDHLSGVLSGNDLQGIVLALADCQALARAVGAEQAKVLSYAELPDVRKVLEDGLAAANTLAQDPQKLEAAITALEAHKSVLATVRACVTRRVEVKNTIGALARAIQQDASWEAQMFTGGNSLDALKTALATADGRAKTGDFAGAQRAYRDIIADCRASMAVAIDKYETADAQGSNAGHSRDSHGAQVTEAEHLTRLMTGMAPGNRLSKTNVSSSFHSDSDWLAGREMGAEMALAKGVDVASTSLPWPGAEPKSQQFIIDHGRAIDVAYRGVRKTQTYDPGSDQFVESNTYVSYEKLTGLTRALVNFVWEVDGPHRTLQDYADAYALANGGAQPTAIPGRWVMMQQFPWAEDWNQAEQRYDKPITQVDTG